MRTLWRLVEHERGKFFAALSLFVIKHSPVWILPLLTANMIDVVVEGLPLRNLWINAAIFAVLLAQNIPLHYLYARFLSQMIRSVELRLRSALVERFQFLSMDYYKRVSAGILQSKMVRDVETIEQMLRQLFDSGAAAVSNMLGALVIIAIRRPNFLFLFLLVVPLSSFLTINLRKILMARNAVFRQKVESMAARTAEMTHLIPITRAHGLEENEMDRMSQVFFNLHQAGFALDMSNAIFGSLVWVTFNLFSGICLVFAAWLSYNGYWGVTPGDVVMVTIYFSSISAAVMTLVSLTPLIVRGLESLRSINEIMQSPDVEKNIGKPVVDSVQGHFEFEQVAFRYPENDEFALREIDLDIEAGQTIAIVGPSGAGKSTLLNLVVGFVRPDCGRVLLDGRDMEQIDLRSYRKYISIVSQDTILIDGSVRDNITYGMPDVSDQRVLAALQGANALDFVNDLPGGLDAVIGEKGSRLSGGQKQRLAIARALIRDPRVLILDEATSALDSGTEKVVQMALENLQAGRTTFWVAHRLSTIVHADRILVLDEGEIIESGRHHDLMMYDGWYRKQYEEQAVV